ncbi:cell cycle checkpoint control protein RAD9B isoform X3 [Rhineura floridana]|uniref:cell cycle checkpoint control protein RAD9B isoform X3 n=1 Tax=Rhineura floridana TaxID=261503 RepID=UPI002AC7F96D|nr:cell cycle checkpoint control protein RAD9B isoform X3 [Rhineura floridana]
MKCVIGGAHVRVFGRAIHAIARISDEFWFDPIEKGLVLRSVNSSRSAYACVFFSSMFFQRYSCRNTPELGLNKTHIQLVYKLVIKAVLPVFRCLNTLERNIEKCNICTNLNDCHIVFQLFCKHGVVKTYNLAFQECEPLQAVFAKHLCPNVMKIQSRQLSDILIHFPAFQDEVTLAVTPVKVCFKTYVEEEMDFAKAMHTEIQISPEEFEYFQVGVDSEITFCLKELRGLLAFAEAITAPVSVHFDVSGKNPALDRSNEDIISSRCIKEMEAAINAADGFTMTEEVVPPNPGYNKFHSLFFGAVSPKKQDITQVFQSLATASDTEDFGNGQQSSTF